mgnify:CR=1 FL=1
MRPLADQPALIHHQDPVGAVEDALVVGVPVAAGHAYAQRHLDAETDPKASTMYRIDNGEVRVALIGNIYEKLSEDQLEDLGIVDVVILPVGGNIS